ncbi:di-heme oxidoreductase family protein [Profundibacter sp.]
MALRPFLLLMAFSFAPNLASSQVGSDPHLSPTPRTENETGRIKAAIRPTTDFTKPEPFEQNPAGAATTPATTSAKIFKSPSGNMDFDRKMEFLLGEALFEKLWVSAPSSTKASDGVGPLYNARSCARCHPNAGRGHPPQNSSDTATSMFLRLSIPGGDMNEIEGYIATLPEPTYGHQLQDISVGGLLPEGKLVVHYEEFEVALAGGEIARLRAPTYQVNNLGYGPMHRDVMLSPRVAPQMIGLGLLEAIPASDIIANADPDDADGDGISGRAQIILSPQYHEPMLGRFGLKAGAATVYQQSAGAFHGDIGISTPLFPAGWGECTEAQLDCRTAPDGNSAINGDLEIPAEGMNAVSFYAENLAVPARRNIDDPQVLRGKQLFYETGCIACHSPKFVTHRLPDRPEQSFQLIWPYSDLLLHDMGEGLADHRDEARASGYEWRTPALWGIGLTKQVSGHSYHLHDGRARSLLEAILWHGGEAEAAKYKVTEMPKSDRNALIEFLESL